MNRPLAITAIGVVVVVAAIGANFLLWQQEMREEPTGEQASAPQAAAKAAAEAATKAGERARTAAAKAAAARKAADEAMARAAVPGASSEAKEAAVKAQAEAKAAEEEARQADDAAKAAKAVADAASQAAQITRDAGMPPAKPGQSGGQTADSQPQGGPIAPSFDIVRINPKGDTVVAGRAAPGSKVRILDNGKVIGEATADKRGEWVFVPETPLPPGTRQLTLESETAGTKATSTASVMLVVPEPGKDIAGRPTTQPQQPLVLKIPETGPEKVTIPEGPLPSVVLQKPTAGQAAQSLSVDAIDYDDAGRLSISGQAPAGSLVQLYLDNGFLGRTTAGGDNRWSITPGSHVEPGLYTLRIDQMEAGKVVARVTLPFSRAEPLAPGIGRYVIVQPGNSLWRIARRTYGTGFQYTVIYEANAAQIADADLIYPGQIFELPRTN